MVTGGNVHATITSTRCAHRPQPGARGGSADRAPRAPRNKEVTASTTTSICFLGSRCPISVRDRLSLCGASSRRGSRPTPAAAVWRG